MDNLLVGLMMRRPAVCFDLEERLNQDFSFSRAEEAQICTPALDYFTKHCKEGCISTSAGDAKHV